jgi:hypothetical protein
MERALRRNRGKLLLPAYLRSASAWLDRPVESIVLVPLEETDALRAAMHELPHEVMRFESTDARQRAQRFLARLRWVNASSPMVLMEPGSEVCGGILTSFSEVIDRAFNIVQLDGEDLRAYGHDRSRGLWVIWDTEVGPDAPEAEVVEVHLIGHWQRPDN